ncbi:hypothetical protein T12_3285 [Trichinella patagoniensis]|uniref:Uncharacterized protein n=1 Tax=Trichinella patagoniensis TaxID=990121 RepID=A0A0V0WSK1_9BILA|nr:hypothetical protein T12_3285 [Trichinella patagoniensis]
MEETSLPGQSTHRSLHQTLERPNGKTLNWGIPRVIEKTLFSHSTSSTST